MYKKLVNILGVVVLSIFLGACNSSSENTHVVSENSNEIAELQEDYEQLQEDYDALKAEYEAFKKRTGATITIEQTEEEPIATIEPTPEITETPTPEPTPSIVSYGAGMLKVGTDIPAGEYMILATDSDGGYFSVSSDANGDDIIFNDNFEYNSIVTVYDGEFLDLSRAKAYQFDEWCSQNSINVNQVGATFKIGVNLPAGEYQLVADDADGGYYCIYPDSRQQDIISNDNFEGQTYVSVSDGQYLTLSRCSIWQ